MPNKGWRRIVGPTMAMVSMGWCWGALADTACAAVPPGFRAGAAVTFYAADAEAAALLRGAIGKWSEGCGAGYGRDMPRLVVRDDPERATYRVSVATLNDSGSQCGWLRGREIEVFRFATGAAGERLHCGRPSLVLAHEIGHALGLDDIDEPRCSTAIMANIHRANRNHRRVQPAECAAVAAAWLDAEEVARLARGGEEALAELVAEAGEPARRRVEAAEPAIHGAVSGAAAARGGVP